MNQDYLYYAFISYKHEDKKWAGWLKRKLEAYRLPIRTRRHYRELPVRTYPIFYDKALRPGLLDQQVRDEVQSSRFLIVVCSRSAKESPEWINKEINFFLEGGGDPGRIIPVIVDQTEHPVSETFPSRLAELNAEETILGVNLPTVGAKGTVLRIVSCMQGIRIEELESEDRKRRLKRAQAAFTCAVLAVAGIAVGVSRFREISRDKAAEEAYKLMEMSNNAYQEGNRREAVQYALESFEKTQLPTVQAGAERMLADALHVYETNTMIPEKTINTDGYVGALHMTEDGKYLLVEYVDFARLEGWFSLVVSLAAYSTETGEMLWSSPYAVDGMELRNGQLFLSDSHRGLVEVDIRTGEIIREITSEQEREQESLLLMLSTTGSSDNIRSCTSPDGKWRLLTYTKNRIFSLASKEKTVPFSCDTEYYDAVFLDNNRMLFLGNGGIWLINLETEEKEILTDIDEDLFTAPVRILQGKERTLCFVKNTQYEVSNNGRVYQHDETNGDQALSYLYERNINLSGGIAAAFWLDDQETAAMLIGYDGYIVVMDQQVRQTERKTEHPINQLCINANCPEWLAFTSVDEPNRIHLYRKHVNEDAQPVTKEFSCRFLRGGTYAVETDETERRLVRVSDRMILRCEERVVQADEDNEVLDEEILNETSFDEEQDLFDSTESAEEDNNEETQSPEAENSPKEYSILEAEGCSENGMILYDCGGLYNLSTGEYQPLDRNPAEDWYGSLHFVAEPDEKHPAVHVELEVVDREKIAVTIYHDLEKAWSHEFPFENGMMCDYSVVPYNGNGWFAFWIFGPVYTYPEYTTDVHLLENTTLIAVDLYQPRTSAWNMDPGLRFELPKSCSGSDSTNPICTVMDGSLIRVIRCTDGKEIRTLNSPAGEVTSFIRTIRNDRYLMVCTANKTSQYFLDTVTGETMMTCSNSTQLPSDPGLIYHESGQWICCALDYNHSSVYPDGYRIDTQIWMTDRRIPLIVQFIPEYGQVICSDEGTVNRYLYPLYTAEELAEKARQYLQELSQTK